MQFDLYRIQYWKCQDVLYIIISVSLHSYKAQLLDTSETFTMRAYIATIKNKKYQQFSYIVGL